jgi:hypothetical protein
MTINEEIKDVLKECQISFNDALPYLISLYLGYKPSYIPEKLQKQINAAGIVKPGKGSEGLIWVVPLFEEQTTGFDWVDKWVDSFAKINPDRRGNGRFAKARMKKFFAKYPEYRKEDVIGATKMYMRSVSDPQYLMKSHNFIHKGQGANAVEELLEWCEKYKRYMQNQAINNHTSNTMQQ